MAWFVVEFGTTNYRSIGTRPNYGTGEIEGPGTTVSTTNGSRLVTGAGTTWLSSNRGRGDAITIATVPYTISRVLSNTQLLLTSDYLGAIAGGLTYSIERHFATLQAWEDCISPATSSLVADARSEVGVTYADTPFGAALTIAGATTDATHTITLTAAERNRHYGIADGGAGTSVVVNPAGTAIVIQDDHVTIECLEIAASAGNGISVSSVAASNKIVIQNNLVHDNPGDGIHMADTSVDVDIYNNIVYDVDRGINLALAVTQADIFNNTVYNCSVNGIDGAAGQGPWGGRDAPQQHLPQQYLRRLRPGQPPHGQCRERQHRHQRLLHGAQPRRRRPTQHPARRHELRVDDPELRRPAHHRRQRRRGSGRRPERLVHDRHRQRGALGGVGHRRR